MVLAVAIVVAVGSFYQRHAVTALRMPRDVDVLLTQTGARTRPFGREIEEVRALAEKDKGSPDAQLRATTLARRAIDLSRSAGDPRMLGRAQAALAPWWDDAEPPARVLLLRAIIRQSLHEFEPALADLDAYVRRVPDDAQGWLTRAVVLTVRGELARAEESCLPVRALAPGLYAATCVAAVKCGSGRSKEGLWGIESALASTRRTTNDELGWASTTQAECALRLGENDRAEKLLRDVLAKDPTDNYARTALADVLLDTHRAREAADLVREFSTSDNLLLRLTIAEKDAGQSHWKDSAKELRSRYDASHLRGDLLHMREEARFALAIDADAKASVDLAKRNWVVQKEPADLRILWEAGVAANDAAALDLVRGWMTQSKIEDPRIGPWLTATTGTGTGTRKQP